MSIRTLDTRDTRTADNPRRPEFRTHKSGLHPLTLPYAKAHPLSLREALVKMGLLHPEEELTWP